MTDKPMTPERLEEIRTRQTYDPLVVELLAEIDRLRAALDDGELFKSIQRVLDEHSAWIARPSNDVTKAIAIVAGIWGSRYAETAERQRDEVQQALKNAEAKLQRQADVYEKPGDGWVCYHCGERFLTPGSAELHFGARPTGITRCKEMLVSHAKAIREKDDEIASARADALEEAKSACLDLTGSDATPTLRPGARMCVRRIDHLARSALTASEQKP